MLFLFSRYLNFCLDFWSCRKNGLIRKVRLISKFIRHNLVNKQLQYAYCPISHEVKTIRQLNLVSLVKTVKNSRNKLCETLYY